MFDDYVYFTTFVSRINIMKNMKKTILLLAIAVLSINIASAKSLVEFGPKVGALLNLSSLNTNIPALSSINNKSVNMGFEVGLQARINLPLNFMVQPEVIYARTNGEFEFGSGRNSSSLEVSSNFIEVPVLVGWQVSIVRIMVGPSFRFNLDDVLTSTRSAGQYEPALNNFVMGYQAGVGVDLGRFTIDARYCGNFNPELKHTLSNSAQVIDYNASKLSLSVGFMIFK